MSLAKARWGSNTLKRSLTSGGSLLVIMRLTGFAFSKQRTNGHGTNPRRPLGETFEKERQPFERSAMVQEESLTYEESLGMRSGP
ncbi:hypothetical protein PC128_g3357 [Phytophthora cactorum]|nr:hypothetical protein PC128_g3357 [Phytophthora cactorum]